MLAIMTHVYLLLDATGSMLSQKQTAIDAVNEYFAGLREGPEAESILVSVGIFNSNIGMERVVDALPANSVRDITHEQYKPAGSTPLYDAIAQAVAQLETRPPEEAKVLVIQTDGE